MVFKYRKIFHEFARTSSTCVLTQIRDSRKCCLQKKRNDRLIDHVPKLGQHTSKPFHLDFRFLSGATEKSGKFEAHPQFSSISHPDNFTSKTSWPFLHLLKKLRCIFFSCEDAKLKLGWIVGILHGWIDNNLSSRFIIKVLHLMT